MCSRAPPPDPNIGIAAQQNAATSASAQKVAEEQLQYTKDLNAEYKPYFDKILQSSIDQGTKSGQRADDQWNQYTSLFQPNEAKVVSDANTLDSAANVGAVRGRAATDFDMAADAQYQEAQRALAASGADAGSGKSLALTYNVNRALGKASAETGATQNLQLQAMQLRQQAANLGRGLPATSIAEQGSAIGSNNAGLGTVSQQIGVNDAGVGTGLNAYGTAINGGQSAATILQNQWNGQAQATSSSNQGTGAVVGAGLTAAAIIF